MKTAFESDTDLRTQHLPQVIGIDLGGTAMKLGRFDPEGHCWQSLTVTTPQPAYPQAVLEAMVEAIAQIDPQNQTIAIGVGTPGPTDATGRVALVAINLEGWKNVPLADWLEAKTGKPTVLANDANCAGLGEYWLGAGRAFQNLVMLTLGTGVGGAVILNGELFVGRHGAAGELGLVTVDLDGPMCNSGNQGSLEQHVSVQAIRRCTGLEPEELGTRARAGDPEAIAFWQRYGRELGAGLASSIYVLTPEAILIGGGISASAEFFFPAVWAEIEQRVLPSSRTGLKLLQAELGNQAGMVGAAKLALQKLGPSEPAKRNSSTAESTLEKQLQQAQLAYQMATEMGQFKAGFLARTSHELRSPINSVITLHQLILSGLADDPAEEREFIVQAHRSALKMLAVLDELIHVAKAGHGTSRVQIQPVELATVLKEVQSFTHLQAENRGLRLEIELPDPEVYVLADPRWLQQVLLSLIDTPIALMQEGTIRVTTHLSLETGQAHVCIEDQRPPETWSESLNLLQTSVTQPLNLPIAKTKDSTSGSRSEAQGMRSPGLTLLMNQTLMELMQGRLEILSVPSEGRSQDALAQQTSDLTRIQCSIPLVIPDPDESVLS